jgi:hypothetical protein
VLGGATALMEEAAGVSGVEAVEAAAYAAGLVVDSVLRSPPTVL